MATPPDIDPSSTLRFILNGHSGSQDGEGTREAIESTLKSTGRTGELIYCQPGELPHAAAKAARQALAERSAIVAVGGDGTINAVAQAAHASGCALGVIPRGTFNYFARTHGLPLDVAEATAQLLAAQPMPVQVGAINDQVFLVNASVGLYPRLLEDREAWKSRFGRNRLVALGAAFATLMRTPNRLKLSIELDGVKRELRTLTLFVGNNRLQLEQVGVAGPPPGQAPRDNGRVTAVVLKPIGTLGMLGLMLRGALGSLGEAEGIEHFEFDEMVVKPPSVMRLRRLKVAFDGEVARMKPPLRFRVMPEPLYLLKTGTSAKEAV
ncbi:diacylglycerol/lipid kinase family protein [Hydrogenophaga sp.]|uniref:diacylglycerol/lipid kinase family protein n=1 Tax=Hydrogenophaga sp. TaxID=1904254 RepID=UPI003F723658